MNTEARLNRVEDQLREDISEIRKDISGINKSITALTVKQKMSSSIFKYAVTIVVATISGIFGAHIPS